MAELRHSARQGQFDSEFVETFIALLQREGLTFGKDADYEVELEFERRVQKMAELPGEQTGSRAILRLRRPSLPGLRSSTHGPRELHKG